MTSLRRAAGELLVVGLGGTELTGLERAWLKLVRAACVQRTFPRTASVMPM